MQAALEGLPGVALVEMDVARKVATVTHDPARTSRADLERAYERVDVRLQTRHRLHRAWRWVFPDRGRGERR